jgi:hypothetical protein
METVGIKSRVGCTQSLHADQQIDNSQTVRIDKIYVGKPMISTRDKESLKREIYPAEVRYTFSTVLRLY